MGFAAIPLAIAAGTAVVGGSVYQGQQQKQAQRRAERSQEQAQRLATSRAAAELRRQQMDERRLNRRKPDVSSLLGQERQRAMTGPGATMLTGAAGIGGERLMLGRSSLLGNT